MRKISTLKETHPTERITLEEIRGVTNEGAGSDPAAPGAAQHVAILTDL